MYFVLAFDVFIFSFDVFIIYRLYMLERDSMFYVSFIVSCFTYATLFIDLYYECKVEFNQPFFWLYSVSICL